MGKYTITDEVLKRYHSGLCPAAESAAVEAWLEDTEEEITVVLDQREEEAINASLWAAIQNSTILKERKRKQLRVWRSRVAVAASLFFASCFFLMPDKVKSTPSRVVQINNFNGRTVKAENIDGLILTAMPRGVIYGRIDDSSGEVTFCNVMLIQNTSVDDVNLNFGSHCPGEKTGSKRFICKKGTTYVALRMHSVSSEIIVVDQRYMEDLLPLNVAMKINKDLQSI